MLLFALLETGYFQVSEVGSIQRANQHTDLKFQKILATQPIAVIEVLCAPMLQAFLEAFADGLEHFDTRVILVIRLDQRPGSGGGAGVIDHVAHGRGVVGPLFPVAPVFVGDLVSLVGGLLALREPAQLLVGRDVQPEFDQHRPEAGE